VEGGDKGSATNCSTKASEWEAVFLSGALTPSLAADRNDFDQPQYGLLDGWRLVRGTRGCLAHLLRPREQGLRSGRGYVPLASGQPVSNHMNIGYFSIFTRQPAAIIRRNACRS
jgi:hypothetical protein